MDDVLVRLALVLGALLVALIFIVTIRMKSRGKPRQVNDHGLGPGLYLFTSSACPDCGTARREIQQAVGNEGFAELSWETNPGDFHRLGVASVPATLVVSDDGSATLYPGSPKKALQLLSP